MMIPGSEEERRRSRRYRIQEGAFAFIDNTPFTIENISEGGMMIQSVVFDDKPDKYLVLDIFLKSEDFYLKNVQVRLISYLENETTTPFSAIQIKCCCLAFENLNEQQRNQLDSLLSKNTIGEV